MEERCNYFSAICTYYSDIFQLDKLKAAIAKRQELTNRRGVVFHYENDKPHVSCVVQNKLLKFHWDIPSHPSYSPNFDWSDCHSFLSLKRFLGSKGFQMIINDKKIINERNDNERRGE